MHHQTEVWAWITCPCPQDPNFSNELAVFALAKIENSTRTSMKVLLPRKPRAGSLLSVEIHRAPRCYSPPIIARVVQTWQCTDGWLTDCKWIAPAPAEARSEAQPSSTPQTPCAI